MTSSLTRNLASATLAVLALPQAACAQVLPLDRVNLPPGFEIESMPRCRLPALALGERAVFVGTRQSGSTPSRRTAASTRCDVADGLNSPMAFRSAHRRGRDQSDLEV
jgi:hypothetical protein